MSRVANEPGSKFSVVTSAAMLRRSFPACRPRGGEQHETSAFLRCQGVAAALEIPDDDHSADAPDDDWDDDEDFVPLPHEIRAAGNGSAPFR